MAQTTRLIYASSMPASAVADSQVINDILLKSITNNTRVGVTGILVAHQGLYLQVLEGTKMAVSTTYQRISEDLRHKDVKILGHVNCYQRLFGRWAMCARTVSQADAEIIDVLARKASFDPYAMSQETALKLLVTISNIHTRQAAR